VPERGQLPADVVGAAAGLHADQARWKGREAALQLRPGHLLPEHDGATAVEADQVEGGLADVDPDCRDDVAHGASPYGGPLARPA
jgi:hypothetical protein